MAILFSTAFTGGPGLIIPDMTITFFGPPGPNFLNNVARTSYLVTVPALMMGVSNLIWVPLMIKLGRRPVYSKPF
jgi:MFS family permease